MRSTKIGKTREEFQQNFQTNEFVSRLPPLLAPIYRDNTVMTVPIIDGIDHKSFEYRPVRNLKHLWKSRKLS